MPEGPLRTVRNPSFTLPMPVPTQNNTNRTSQSQPYQHRSEPSPWQDHSSTASHPQRQEPQPQQQQQFPPPSPPLQPDLDDHYDIYGRDFYGSTPDFDAFDWDSLPNSPPPNEPPNQTSESSIVDLTETSPAMPRTTSKRKSPTPEVGRRSKRLKNESLDPGQAKAEEDEDGPNAQVEELDLVDVEDDSGYAEAMKKRQEDLIKQQRQEELDKPIKLATTQCVICLDQPEDMVVTHCGRFLLFKFGSVTALTLIGHMFCSLCLHGALNIGTGKRTCPVCRTAIGAVKKDGKQPKNGIFHLEMKLMSKKQGKKPVLR